MKDNWSITEHQFSARTAKAYEGLFTLGSGYLHIRGSLEEHLSGAPQNVTYTRMPANVTSETFRDAKSKWGTYVPGLTSRHPLLNRQMVNLPMFLELCPIVGGQRLDVEACRISDYRRELDLRTATLMRTLTWRTEAGAALSLMFERFVSLRRPHLCVQRLTIQGPPGEEVTIQAGIDTDVRTNGYDHFSQVQFQPMDGQDLACRVTTDAGDVIEIQTHLEVNPPASGQSMRCVQESARIARLACRCAIPASGRLVIEKRSSVHTSRDLEETSAADVLRESAALTYDELHAEHAADWAARWDSADVTIEGDAQSQLAMRASIYHLLRAHVSDDRVAIDAKGYAGEAYWGRFFWDTEMYLLPFFLYTNPAAARTLVDFRVQSLGGARANARRYGYAGARYAWESDPEGNECCPNWQYGDHEVHVTADVAHGLAHYAAAAGGDYLSGPAASVLVETARYWMQRMDWRKGESHPSLLGVMGPDEYKPISHNNAYTNWMVARALELAAKHGQAGGASEQQRAAFAQAAAGLPILRAADGVLVMQCEGFDELAEPRFDELWKDRDKSYAAQVSQERLYRSKCLKQADVLMLMALFPRHFTDREVRAAWEHYLPYTTHDSSLSAGVHAIIACRLGMMDEAWTFWKRSAEIDLDVEHGGAAEGIHIAGDAANWQVAVMGFAGMLTAMQADALTLSPRLPRAWTRLAFPIVWRGCPVYVDIRGQALEIANHGRKDLNVVVWGLPATVRPGQMERFELGQQGDARW